MASAGVRCGGNHFLFSRRQNMNADVRPPCTVAAIVPKNDKKKKIHNVRMSAASMTVGGALLPKKLDSSNYSNNNKSDKAVVYEKLDEWMRDSVVEIVKNLKEAPLLVQVYPKNDDGKTSEVMLRTEKAREENWPVVIRKWRRRENLVPEGVIFVDQLEEEEEGDGNDAKDHTGMASRSSRNTREWGIVVQGRGADCEPVCYLLKTTSAESYLGGSWCTHFCLIKVKNFKETAKSQLKKCWLCQAS